LSSGSSGGALAARLSEDENHNVILLEAGPDYVREADIPEPLRDAFNPQLVGHDWGFSGYSIEPVEERPAAPYPRGRVVGGRARSTEDRAAALREDFESWGRRGQRRVGMGAGAPSLPPSRK